MTKINAANLRRTLWYLRRNGIANTWYAIRERLSERQAAPYVYIQPTDEELSRQRDRWKLKTWHSVSLSVVVPLYRTNPRYLTEMLDSVWNQTFRRWELILADATEDESVEKQVNAWLAAHPQEPVSPGSNPLPCGQVRYLRLPDNAGISANTNRALEAAQGAYVCLLDHDDLLTPDALSEVADAIHKAWHSADELQILYSDEDKCSADATEYYEPNHKEDFNFDLLLSNNYICHLLVMKRELIQKLQLRPAYDGAQDYDLVLRAATELDLLHHPENERLIAHIPHVLYHWRCHDASTAENPRSKQYAYEAGLRALQDYADTNAIPARAVHLKHLGFYRLDYLAGASDTALTEPEAILRARPDVGAVAGCVTHGSRILDGRRTPDGTPLYAGLSVHDSGYLHRAVLTQDAHDADPRALLPRPDLAGLDCPAIRARGCRIFYLPSWKIKV